MPTITDESQTKPSTSKNYVASNFEENDEVYLVKIIFLNLSVNVILK